MLHLLRIRSGQAWEITSKRLLFLLHKYRARDFALMLSIFHTIKDIDSDDTADVISNQNVASTTWKNVQDKIPDNFFERLVSMLPMHIPQMTNRDLVSTLEVLVARNLGGKRLFDHYIYLKIERNVLKFTND